MKLLAYAAVAATLISGVAMAQTTTHPGSSSSTAATTSSSGPAASAMTENEAKQKIEAQGYTNVTDLKEQNGMWQGQATKAGKKEKIEINKQGQVVPSND